MGSGRCVRDESLSRVSGAAGRPCFRLKAGLGGVKRQRRWWKMKLKMKMVYLPSKG